ncbi:MAG: DUF554 domain-containing protein [Synergistaceae bacterium]|jgi:uncharacterized membrane protein YqgA involved in biofilm formation|nr:DUF554 domain-containing protein [Synergistaceae bacterium]
MANNTIINAVFGVLPASGSIFNALLIILGTVIGLTVGGKLPDRLTGALMSSIGVFIMYLGFDMTRSSEGMLNMLFSFVGGSAIGEALNIHIALSRFGEWAKRSLRMKDERFGEAMISASLIYCTGSLAILGSIEEGLGKFPAILIAKSVIDGVSSIVFAISLGVGVGFSAIAVLIYQCAITFTASAASAIMNTHVINSMTAVGGLMVICIGLNILGVAKIRTSNQLPGIVIAAAGAAFF